MIQAKSITIVLKKVSLQKIVEIRTVEYFRRTLNFPQRIRHAAVFFNPMSAPYFLLNFNFYIQFVSNHIKWFAFWNSHDYHSLNAFSTTFWTCPRAWGCGRTSTRLRCCSRFRTSTSGRTEITFARLSPQSKKYFFFVHCLDLYWNWKRYVQRQLIPNFNIYFLIL